MAHKEDSQTRKVACFGPFRLFSAARLLLKDDRPVAMGSRAFDILLALTERPGEVVDRRHLIKRAWPGMIVEEANLRVNVAHLRKVLGQSEEGPRYVTNVPGRGYCFVAPVEWLEGDDRSKRDISLTLAPLDLPAPPERMVGRARTVSALVSQLASRRFVSIVGPGGIGKTTVAIAVAHAMAVDFAGAAFFVDLGALTNVDVVATAVASTLKSVIQTQDPVADIVAFIGDKRVLLVLDSCEHVITAVTNIASQILEANPNAYLLTTTREILRVDGETVTLLSPLEIPTENDVPLTAAECLAWPAVQLFMDRATAGGHNGDLSDKDAPIVAEICRQLDGIPLAIELAASRVGAYGIEGVACLVDRRIRLLLRGRRNTLPRHQTLSALLDWSFNLLTSEEKTVLRSLSAFVGVFTLEAAQAVAGDQVDIPRVLESLVDKSLVSTHRHSEISCYRLLDTTRDYAAVELAKSGKEKEIAERHATYFTSLALEPSESSQDYSIIAPLLHIGNLRKALHWSFSDGGNAKIAVALCANSMPLFLKLSLLVECREWCEHAILRMTETDCGTTHELVLQEAFAIASYHTRGNSDAVQAALYRGLELAGKIGDYQRQLRLLAGLNLTLSKLGDFVGALAIAKRFSRMVSEVGTRQEIVAADWMLGAGYHLVGNQGAAYRHYKQSFEHAALSVPVHVDYFGYDHRMRALVGMARTLWLRGLPEQSLRVAREAIDEAECRSHPPSLCMCLLYSIPIFLWSSDLRSAELLIDRLIDLAPKHSLRPHEAGGLALKGELMIERGEIKAGVEILRKALYALQAAQLHIVANASRRAFCKGLALSGNVAEALASIDVMLRASERHGGAYDTPRLLLTHAEILLSLPQADLSGAEEAMLRSLIIARAQSALGWELQAAIALAKLRMAQGRVARAKPILESAYRQFTEGFTTADLRTARQLLCELETHPTQLRRALR